MSCEDFDHWYVKMPCSQSVAADLPPGQPRAGIQSGDVLGEIASGGMQAVGAKFGEAVKYEQSACRRVGDAGADALPPVPGTAGNAEVVAPDHFAWLRVGDDRLPVAYGVERLVPGRTYQARGPAVSVQVLAADRQQMPHRHRVV